MKNWRHWLKNPEKLKKLVKQFVGTLKHLGREAKEKLETLLEDNPRIIKKLENAPKWTKKQLDQELNDDENFAHAAVWEHKGDGKIPARHKENLQYDNVKLAVRSYK